MNTSHGLHHYPSMANFGRETKQALLHVYFCRKPTVVFGNIRWSGGSTGAPSKNIKHIQGLHLISFLVICSRPVTVSAENRFCMGYIQTRQPEDRCKIRERRGRGARHRVAPTVKIPSNWKTFLHVNENKTEHFRLLAQEAGSIDAVQVKPCSTDSTQAVSKTTRESLEGLQPCSHEKSEHLYFFACSPCSQGTPKNHDKDSRYRCLRSCFLADTENSSERSLTCFWHGKAV